MTMPRRIWVAGIAIRMNSIEKFAALVQP